MFPALREYYIKRAELIGAETWKERKQVLVTLDIQPLPLAAVTLLRVLVSILCPLGITSFFFVFCYAGDWTSGLTLANLVFCC